MVANMLRCCELVAFTPALQQLVACFDWNDIVLMVEQLRRHWQIRFPRSWLRYLVNAVASILDGVSDVTKIDAMLSAVPHAPLHTTTPGDGILPDEYARILERALAASSKRVDDLVLARDLQCLAHTVSPAVSMLASEIATVTPPPQWIREAFAAVVQSVVDQFGTLQPAHASHLILCPDLKISVFGYCTTCAGLEQFINNPHREVAWLEWALRGHVLHAIKFNALTTLQVEETMATGRVFKVAKRADPELAKTIHVQRERLMQWKKTQQAMQPRNDRDVEMHDSQATDDEAW